MMGSEIRRGPPELTSEQREVVRFVVAGWTDERIADRLGIGTATVQRRLRAAATALGVRSRVEVAVRAVSLGLAEPPAEEESESGGEISEWPK